MRLPGASRDEPLIGVEQTTGLAGGHDFIPNILPFLPAPQSVQSPLDKGLAVFFHTLVVLQKQISPKGISYNIQ